MILLALLLTPLLTGMACLVVRDQASRLPKIITTGGLLASLAILCVVKGDYHHVFQLSWIKTFNINFHLALSGLSFWLCALTVVMGLCGVFMSKPQRSTNTYYAALCWSIMSMMGIFLAADVFLFFVFWELALLPLYFLLLTQSLDPDHKALFRYIIYTQASGLVLLFSIVGLVIAHLTTTGLLTFDYETLSKASLPLDMQRYLLLSFTLAFMIKLPLVPFHGWLSPLFRSAPAAIIVVGVLVKTAVFGLMQFSWPLFPEACQELSIPLMGMGIFTLIYGSILAFGQSDPKSVVAYGTLSHVGFMLVGVFSHTKAAYAGVVLLMVAQSLSTGGIMMVLNYVYGDNKSITIKETGGLWHYGPRASVFLLIFLLASLGAPLSGNFLGEWLVLLGVFSEWPVMAVIAALGIILSAVYCLWLFQRLCLGTGTKQHLGADLRVPEMFMYSFMVFALVFLGLTPKDITDSLISPVTISQKDTTNTKQ